MSLELLKSAIEQQERLALGYQSGELSQARADALRDYLSEPYGNEVEGRSQVVTSDVADTIEGVLPGLIRVFTSGEDICQFQPSGPEDEETAKQETDIVNYFLTQSNNFTPFLQTWLRDGLISINGYAKIVWEDDEYQDQETYNNLDENELAYLLQSPELEVVEQSQDEMGFWAVKLKKTVNRGRIKLYNCPPEQILVNNDHTEVSLRNARFVQHRVKMTISEIREMGYKIDDDIGDEYDNDWTDEWDARDRWETMTFSEGETNDPASRVVTFRETYIRYDFDGDGHTELRRVCSIGSTVLQNEEWDSIPICAWTPVIMPHRHVGRGMAEQVADVQKTKTSILRTALDSLYLSIHGRWAVSDSVNLDDMLVSRPNGVVRLHDGALPSQGHIMPLIPPALAGQAFPALEYMDSVRESRTGITRYNQGLDANSLNKTATGVQSIMSAAQGRIELIARTFAETGLKDLVLMAHELIRKHCDKDMVVKLRNKWVPVDPRVWKTRFDMTISVGLGTGNREQQMAHLMAIMNIQREAFQIGIASPENIYNSATKMAEIAGFKSPELFFTNGQKQPSVPPEVQKQIQDQMQQASKTIQTQQDEINKLKAELLKRDADTSVKVYEVNKRSETEIAKVQLQNESKEQLAQFQAAFDAMMQNQNAIADRVTQMQGDQQSLDPIMQALQVLAEKIENAQPVAIRQVRDESGRLIGGIRIMPDGTEQEIQIQ
jgi:hypothetical protein